VLASALAEMQKIIDADKNNLFDVLAHVAYANDGHHQRILQAQTEGTYRLRVVAL
jgi:hypothetical protein